MSSDVSTSTGKARPLLFAPPRPSPFRGGRVSQSWAEDMTEKRKNGGTEGGKGWKFYYLNFVFSEKEKSKRREKSKTKKEMNLPPGSGSVDSNRKFLPNSSGNFLLPAYLVPSHPTFRVCSTSCPFSCPVKFCATLLCLFPLAFWNSILL